MRSKLKRGDLLFPDLSYTIIGCAFDVHNTLGSGHHEKYYQKALQESFISKSIAFQKEVDFPIHYNGKVIGRKRLDFLVDGNVVVELKKGNYFAKSHIDQVLEYLRMNNLKLAILINFGSQGVVFKRIINL